jgi:hypothetical protein
VKCKLEVNLRFNLIAKPHESAVLRPSSDGAAVDDKTILDRIHVLVDEEKALRNGSHGLTSAQRQRLQQLEEQLDQAWDLLRQRRAREETGENPDDARTRAVNEVEGYLQ